jgi:capsular polysaccharide export protein
MVAARVGGAFWLKADSGREPIVVASGGDLAAALAAHLASDIVVLSEGALARAGRAAGCRVIEAADPWSLIDRGAEFFAGGACELGFLATLTGRRVCWHGAGPFRRDELTSAELAHQILVAETSYRDPYSGGPASAEATIDLLASWRPVFAANREIACCVGMSTWKRRRIAWFFHSGDRKPAFRRSAAAAVGTAARTGGAIAVWNSRHPPGLAPLAARAGIKLIRVEDGFLRSVGLGSDFLPPSSVIADSRGIYYDPTSPSDLEYILGESAFDAALIERARRLIGHVLARGITKYNAGGAAPSLAPAGGRKRILVPGQVADDLSVRLGGGSVRTNLHLLRQVRAENPDSFLIYKPHPDVEAGHRPGAIAPADLAGWADQVVRGGAMASLIDQVDEVHTMTSLAGFEALLRRRPVKVYGQPFYAGWGLTRDVAPMPHRRRLLTLEELVAGVLILYPRYLDPVTCLPCSPELLIERLADSTLWQPGWLMRLRQFQGRVRRAWPSARPRLAPESEG